MRAIIILHRYLAVAVGLLMTLWCLSGFVMMYQEMPSLSQRHRLAALEPLDFAGCCDVANLPGGGGPARPFRIEMLRGVPVLRGATTVDLRTGRPVEPLSEADVLDVANRFGRNLGVAGSPRSLGTLDVDQWTLQSAGRNRPAWHVAFDDPRATEIYVNGSTGEVFQKTTRRERVLAWFGAIPHWLYPTVLRQNGPVWTQIVIWGSVVGAFLALTGLYVGISRFRPRRRGAAWSSPFRGWWYWHHVIGLVFGVLTLTWVFSGLMTMSPWGLLEGGRGSVYLRAFSAGATAEDVRRLVAALPVRAAELGDMRQIVPAPFDGEFHVLAVGPEGARQRLDAQARPSPLDGARIEAAIAGLPVGVRRFELMTKEDSYWYAHKNEARLPVYRAILDDDEGTRLYVDPETGAVRAVGSTARTSRWIRRGLHGLDFAGLRVRPVWDVVVMLLLAGVTAVCVTGTWMALRRIRMDFRRLRS